MNPGRERILSAVRRALGREPDGADRAPVDAVLSDPSLRRFPFRPTPADRAGALLERARARGITGERTRSLDELPRLVVEYLAREGLPPRLRVAPHPPLLAAPWAARPEIAVSVGAPADDDPVGLTLADHGIVETGSLVLTSSGATPHSLGFLPPTVVVVLDAANVVGALEDVFAAGRRRAEWPRALTVVSACAATGDIEAHFVRGPHGPGRVHLILVDPAGDG